MMRVILLCLCLLFSCGAYAYAGTEEVLDKLKTTMGNVQSLKCRFVQHKTLAMFDDTLESQGVLLFQSPDRLRWEYISPVKAGFVVAGKQGRRWNTLAGTDEPFRVADDVEMRILTEQVLKWTCFDLDALREQYEFAVASKKPLKLVLTPKSTVVRRLLRELRVTLSPAMSDVAKLEFIEADGDVTTYTFFDTIINSDIDASLLTP
ncbi:LolA family protein [Halodesulfovibrio marinisediminis]|uniref:Outer membrane lipoprotein-sorting protein n=1 Tax=Halodesulfovibrio marinisediminis DSM 17456 TaxID=1121457 RepID=A0A1N6EC76_9BACT|nr:outer membrane lipoprotein carrier protein LolA [Halodesulfovibrio marinisediminis]SIN80571.1 Outer membrane lipoprotein-sorting protein [Halodesulfovibrio marinisediminis DSM 17456]